MQHVAIYVRVSSRKQDTKSQEPDLKQWTIAYGGERVKWYRDTATGKSMDRAGWRRLEADIDAGKVSQVVCWRLDRLGRTASGLTALFEKLAQRQVNLVSIRDGVDLSTAAGRLLANVLASVAAYETEVRGERVRAGLDAARAAGKKLGGSKQGRLIRLNEEKIATIHRMHREGESKSAMARATGVSRATVLTVIQRMNGQG